MTRHGGRLQAASRRYGIPVADWLDLSTGIAPWSWPVPAMPERVWARLPEAEDDLLPAAADYYGVSVDGLTAVPGSQFAIRALPAHLPAGTVAVPRTGYTEHALAWRAAGHALRFYDDIDDLRVQASNADHAVVIQPNNPTGERLDATALAALRDTLGDGWLLVDEAFMDTQARDSLAPALPDNTLVLRSLGKFFGLAGLRLGFVIGRGAPIEALRAWVAPWGVSHPARWIGARALADRAWQAAQRTRIQAGEKMLCARLRQTFPDARLASAGLFASLFFDDARRAPAAHAALAARGVLTRLGDDDRWLRFGLPGAAGDRLTRALARLDRLEP